MAVPHFDEGVCIIACNGLKLGHDDEGSQPAVRIMGRNTTPRNYVGLRYTHESEKFEVICSTRVVELEISDIPSSKCDGNDQSCSASGQDEAEEKLLWWASWVGYPNGPFRDIPEEFWHFQTEFGCNHITSAQCVHLFT